MHDAYAAGLFDGEGMIRMTSHIHRDKVTRIYQIQCVLGVVHRPVIEALKEEYGGSIHENRHDLRSPRNRIVFQWAIASQKAASFMRRIQPYVVIKRDQLELALEFQSHIDEWRGKLGNRAGFHPDRDKVFAWRADVARRLTEMKKVSFPSLVDRGTGAQ